MDLRQYKKVTASQGRYLRSGLVDSRQSSLNTGVLKLALAKVVFDGCPRGFHGGACLCHFRLIVVVLKLNEEIAFVHLLIIGHVDIADDAGRPVPSGVKLPRT